MVSYIPKLLKWAQIFISLDLNLGSSQSELKSEGGS